MTPEEIKESAVHTLNAEKKALELMIQNVDDNFVKAVQKIFSLKGRVIVSGMGKPGHIGKKIAASLASTGTPAFFVHPAEASHGDLGMLTKEDLVLCLSNSGESKELFDIINYFTIYIFPQFAVVFLYTSIIKYAPYIYITTIF